MNKYLKIPIRMNMNIKLPMGIELNNYSNVIELFYQFFSNRKIE